MPWSIQKTGRCPKSKPYGLIRRDGGKLEGCHASRAAARRQMAAIGMSEAGKEKQMPYPNEHACRIKDPDDFQAGSFRRISRGGKAGKGPRDGKKLSIVIGRPKGKTTTTTQAYRYPVKTWTEAQARQHCQEQGGKFEAASKKKEGIDPMTDEFLADELGPARAIRQGGKTEEEAMEPDEVKMIGLDEPYPHVPFGVYTFADLVTAEAAEEAASDIHTRAYQFQRLIDRILDNPEVEDKATAIVELAEEFADLVRERMGEAEDEMETRELEMPSGSVSKEGWFDDLLSRVKEALLGLSKPKPETSGLMLWKEADGTYRWLARYSNNFRDKDNPPEIISAKSHQRFVELVDKGEAACPELWLWHRPEWKWGKATWLAYDDSGFALAAGTVDKDKGWLAEHLMEIDPSLVRVSHGMPTDSIVRDADDPSVIVGHVTREISPLPAWAAANSLTGFNILKEVQDMTIPKDKRDGLAESWNLSTELLDQLEAANASDAKEEAEAGTEQKEKEVETETATAPTEPEPEADQALPEPAITRAEVRAVLETVGQAIAALTEQVKELQGQVVEVKETKSVEEAETLSDIFQRAIGHPDARVDGRTTEAKDRPRETRAAPDQVVNSGHPLADQIINSIVSGDWLNELGQRPQ